MSFLHVFPMFGAQLCDVRLRDAKLLEPDVVETTWAGERLRRWTMWTMWCPLARLV